MSLYQNLHLLKVYILHMAFISIILFEVKILLSVLLLRKLPELVGNQVICTKYVSLLMIFPGWLSPCREGGGALELK